MTWAHPVAIDCIVAGCRTGDAGGSACACAPDQTCKSLLDAMRDEVER